MSQEPTDPSELVVEHVPNTPPVDGMEPAVPPPPPSAAPVVAAPMTPQPPPQYAGVMLPPKSVGVAYAMMLFTLVGVAGIQHFYIGKVGRGILWLLTFGLFGFGSLVDLFTLPGQVRQVNAQRAVGIS